MLLFSILSLDKERCSEEMSIQLIFLVFGVELYKIVNCIKTNLLLHDFMIITN